MRTFALFGAKKISDFSKLMECPHGQGVCVCGGRRLSQCGQGGSVFRDIVRTSFMDGP